MNKQLQYNPRADIDWRQVKEDTLRYCCGRYTEDIQVTESQIMDVNMPIWTALISVDFDLNMFFSKKAYRQIRDKELTQDYILWVCLPLVNPLSEYYIDIINGYLDFVTIDQDIAASAEWNPGDEIQILEYLYYCRNDEDIWWLLGQGVGRIKELYNWYMGVVQTPKISNGQYPPCNFVKNEKKALRMILFLEFYLVGTNKALGVATKTLYNSIDERKTIWYLLLPEITEEGCEYLAQEYELSAAQIYNVVVRFMETMDGLPTGWGMDLFSKMNILGEFCYTECHPKI